MPQLLKNPADRDDFASVNRGAYSSEALLRAGASPSDTMRFLQRELGLSATEAAETVAAEVALLDLDVRRGHRHDPHPETATPRPA